MSTAQDVSRRGAEQFQFLSGMKEDLSMYGNELVTAVTLWNVGYVLGQIPINLILTRVDPRWVIPTVSL